MELWNGTKWSIERSEGGEHVMNMYFTTQLPLGEMLFENWKVISKSDLSWAAQYTVLKLLEFMTKKVD